MGFPEDETSISTSAPVELYEFIIGSTTYRYCRALNNLTYGGNNYNPAVVRRGMLDAPSIDEPQELVVELPISDAFVQAYGFSIPPKKIACNVLRLQTFSGIALQIWTGKVGSINVRGRSATIRVPCLLDDSLEAAIPNKNFQYNCNHVLFDEMCSLDPGDFDRAVTISSFSGRTIIVSSVTAGFKYKNGKIMRNSDGEYRMIVNQSTTTLTIDYPFRSLANGDAMTIWPGCDHTPIACRDDFDNIVNYGGHPNIPSRNPFDGFDIWNGF